MSLVCTASINPRSGPRFAVDSLQICVGVVPVICFTFAWEDIFLDLMEQSNKVASVVQCSSLARHRYINKQRDHWIVQATHGQLGSLDSL